MVGIDTLGPVGVARNTTATRGRRSQIAYAVRDATSPEVTWALQILRDGRVVKQWAHGLLSAPAPRGVWWVQPFWCDLPAGDSVPDQGHRHGPRRQRPECGGLRIAAREVSAEATTAAAQGGSASAALGRRFAPPALRAARRHERARRRRSGRRAGPAPTRAAACLFFAYARRARRSPAWRRLRSLGRPCAVRLTAPRTLSPLPSSVVSAWACDSPLRRLRLRGQSSKLGAARCRRPGASRAR